ncbi:MAG: restriction endonuclease subunit S [Saprospiraceae bacterium]|nr:restriction endonuclease subunit S [Saprospiraceae bacterium]
MKQGWEIKKLGEVCELSAGGDVPKDNFSEIKTEQHQIPIYANGEKNNGFYGFTSIAKVIKPSITVSARGTIGYSVKRLEAFFPIVRLIVVTPINLKELDLDFLDYALRKIDFKHSGSSIPQLTVPMIRDYEIPIPPLPDQHRIVSILDEAFTAIAKAKANAEQNLRNAKELFESYLQRVFEKGNWDVKTLNEVCEIVSKLIDPRKPEFQKLIHVGAGNIETKTGLLSDLKTSKEENLISGKFLFDESMVLYSKIRPYLMKVVNCNFRGLCSADIYPLKPFEKLITKDYLYHLLLTKEFTDYAILGSQRAGMPKVNREHLFAYKLKLPSLTEQQVIVQKLDALSAETKKLEAIYQQKINDLDELKKSILQKAFSGELKTAKLIEI